MMRGLLLVVALAVVYSEADKHMGYDTPEAKACLEILKPSTSKEDKKAMMEKCIAAQPGLQATIDDLTAGAEVAKPHPGCKGGRKGNPMKLLKAAGKTAEMTALNKCLAKENGDLLVAADGSESFDVAKFKGEIRAKVEGSSSQANTVLGLDNCPEADLAAFNVYKFMQCLKAYCATGAAPTMP